MTEVRGEPVLTYAIRNGLIVDGTGGDPFSGDVVIRDGKIVNVGVAADSDVDVSIDASGLVVSPGFVDVHTHADLLPFTAPEDEPLRRAALLQGVTTAITGNCGFSVFPVPSEGRAEEVGRHLAALFGEGVRTFTDLNSYAAEAVTAGLDCNLATLVGQGTLRASVIGFDPRPASEPEIQRMRALTREALDQGALGLSTGLLYPPGAYADTDEIVEIVSELTGTDRLYVTHMRNEMDRVGEALREAIEIGRQTSVKIQISHLKSAGRKNHGRLTELLHLIERSVDAGVDISADAYPYERGSTVLHALLPPWATEGGIEATIGRLEASDVRQRMRRAFEDPPTGWQNFIEGGSWGDVIIASAPRNNEVEGLTIAEAASMRGRDPIDFVADLLISESGLVTIIVAMADEDDVTTCLSSPRVMVGSDGIPIPGKPHPRWAGSFARMLSRAQRDRFGLSISEVVHKMSGLPARRFGLGGMGTIETGNTADLVVFEGEKVRDTATYTEPLSPATGVLHVFVNGHHVVSDGVDTGLRAGRMVRAGGE